MDSPPALQQISLSLSRKHDAIAPATRASPARQQRDRASVRQAVLQWNEGGFSSETHERLSPFNICVSKVFASRVRRLHWLLDRVLVDIVDRWLQDQAANFPGRMPLEQHEEEVLKWIDGPGAKIIPPFGKRYGTWRTDYCVERSLDGWEQAKIVEINSRIPYNGFWLTGLHEEATGLLGDDERGRFKPANNSFTVSYCAAAGPVDTH